MKFKLDYDKFVNRLISKHAAERAAERGISLDDVYQTLTEPHVIEASKTEAHNILCFREVRPGRVVCVVFGTHPDKPRMVASAYPAQGGKRRRFYREYQA